MDLDNILKSYITNPFNTTKVNLPFVPLETIRLALEQMGLENYASDTNGWQVDFWMYFKDKFNNKFLVDGSLFYGNFKISRIKDE